MIRADWSFIPDDVKSTENFVAWLERQPSDKPYDYTDVLRCPVAQYLQAHGVPQRYTALSPYELRQLGWHGIVLGPLSFKHSTFGSAARRGRAMLQGSWWEWLKWRLLYAGDARWQ